MGKAWIERWWPTYDKQKQARVIEFLENEHAEERTDADFEEEAEADMEQLDAMIDLFGTKYSAMALLKDHDENAYDGWINDRIDQLQGEWFKADGRWWEASAFEYAMDEVTDLMEREEEERLAMEEEE